MFSIYVCIFIYVDRGILLDPLNLNEKELTLEDREFLYNDGENVSSREAVAKLTDERKISFSMLELLCDCCFLWQRNQSKREWAKPHL